MTVTAYARVLDTAASREEVLAGAGEGWRRPPCLMPFQLVGPLRQRQSDLSASLAILDTAHTRRDLELKSPVPEKWRTPFRGLQAPLNGLVVNAVAGAEAAGDDGLGPEP